MLIGPRILCIYLIVKGIPKLTEKGMGDYAWEVFRWAGTALRVAEGRRYAGFRCLGTEVFHDNFLMDSTSEPSEHIV